MVGIDSGNQGADVRAGEAAGAVAAGGAEPGGAGLLGLVLDRLLGRPSPRLQSPSADLC